MLGELIAQTIERETDLEVERKLNLGGTLICERALASGAIDIYVEYSGTALTALFKQPVAFDRKQVLETVRQRYAATGRTMLSPLGFNNTFAILVRRDTVERTGVKTISDAARFAPEWRAGFGYEFLEREDGYKGLAKTYGLTFREPPRVMELNLSYRALASNQVDLIAGDATAGAIAALDLVHAGRRPSVFSALRCRAGDSHRHRARASRGARRARNACGTHRRSDDAPDERSCRHQAAGSGRGRA